MSKLYVFGIGGTGSRVLKSLTMLLAAGVKINTDEIVPVIIDPDHANKDLTRTVELMRYYNNVYDKISQTNNVKNEFFRTKINLDILPSVTMPINNTLNTDFKGYIELAKMKDEKGNPNANYALASLLFSDKNLDSKMDVGFKGNPNIGSVVLNQLADSDVFKNLKFEQNDRIFIISSIFGGTGAAGFPLLLKNLRAMKDDIAGNNYVKNAPIGAISVLPYFDVAPDPAKKSEIDGSTFISKTKAALSYYERNLKEANALYYIADDISKQYPNSQGGTTQCNDAHFVELASALAVIDFARKNNYVTKNGEPQGGTVYKEFGVKDAAQTITFGNLDGKTNSTIKKPLTQFTLFCKYLNERIWDSYKTQPWATDHKFDDKFINTDIADIAEVKNTYIEWLTEMASNNRAFKPYDLAKKEDKLFELITDEQPAKGIFELKKNYDLFDSELNSLQSKVKDEQDKPLQSFVELFFLATEKLVKSKFRM